MHTSASGGRSVTAQATWRVADGTGVQRTRFDANGSKWRLRSLLAMGHSCARIAAAMGVHPSTVQRLVSGDTRTISAARRAAVIAVFERWWDKTPPERTRHERAAAVQARRRAARND